MMWMRYHPPQCTTDMSLQPQLTRTRWHHDLNGYWGLSRERPAADGETAAALADEYRRGFSPEKTVAVPSSINDLYTEFEWRTPAKPVWWYQTTFRAAAAWRGQRVVLRFGAVSYRALVYLNGMRCFFFRARPGEATSHVPQTSGRKKQCARPSQASCSARTRPATRRSNSTSPSACAGATSSTRATATTTAATCSSCAPTCC